MQVLCFPSPPHPRTRRLAESTWFWGAALPTSHQQANRLHSPGDTWDSAKPRDLSLGSGVKCPFELECGVSLPALSGGKEVYSTLGKVLQWRTEKGRREEGQRASERRNFGEKCGRREYVHMYMCVHLYTYVHTFSYTHRTS